MKAIGLYRYLPIDNPESLVDVVTEKPVSSGHDLLVHVEAISVNPVDVKRRTPKDLVEKTPRILGWDVAGVVEQVGSEVSLFTEKLEPITASNLREAHKRVESGKMIGKIVLADFPE